MPRDESFRRSRWMLRVMEWDEPRARYPNLWHGGMPRHVLAFDRVGSRLRLGDLVAIYYPTSVRHAERSNRFVGISRVVGLRQADDGGHAWVDLETAHAFAEPIDPGRAPRRVFLCCDPGWPEPEVGLFQKIFDSAVAEGWQPTDEELGQPAHPGTHELRGAREAAAETDDPAPDRPRRSSTAPASPPAPAPEPGERTFAGADYSGDMRDPREGTWLAVVGLHGDRLVVRRVEATGRHGLESALRNPDRALMSAEAIGLAFPFGLPQNFAESLLDGPFPDEGWWALAKRLERLSWPDYLVRLQEFRDRHGEVKRLTDERAGAGSPLHRVDPDLGSRTYHGVRMVAADRSRYAVRPFESAQGHLVFEVWPEGALRALELEGRPPEEVLDALAARARFPLEVPPAHRRPCLERRDALDAVIAARCAALAVLSGEVERPPDELTPEAPERVRVEGWIYGLAE